MMKDIRFKSPIGHYRAEATIIGFSNGHSLIQERGFKNPDIISVADGAKSLIIPEYTDGCDRAFLMDQIKKSVALHHSPQAILMLCKDEQKKHPEELEEAISLLKKEFDEKIKITILFVDKPHDRSETETTILYCFDARFSGALNELIQKRKFKNPDVIRVAGGAKNLVAPEYTDGCDRAFLMDQIKKSVALHHSQEIILMLHSDCGAYGGLKIFGGDKKSERKKRVGELEEAKTFLQKALGQKIEKSEALGPEQPKEPEEKEIYKNVKIHTIFVDFEKISVI